MGDSPTGLAGAEWAETVGPQTLESLQRGFNADAERADGWPPSSSEFAALCRPPREPESDAPRTYLGSPPVRREFTAIESDRSREVAKREIATMCEQYGVPLPEGFKS